MSHSDTWSSLGHFRVSSELFSRSTYVTNQHVKCRSTLYPTLRTRSHRGCCAGLGFLAFKDSSPDVAEGDKQARTDAWVAANSSTLKR
jgi:hypothetical protein